MNLLFSDTQYFVAVINPHDQWHAKALTIEPIARNSHIVTTEDVLIETLNFFSKHGARTRFQVSGLVRDVLLNPNFEVLPREQTTFLDALELYEDRLDKGYSLTDCISMNVCRKRGVLEILTHDHHFEQ